MVLKTLCGKSIGKVVGGGDSFRPKISGSMGIKHHSTGHLKKCAIFSFCHSIFLRCIRARGLMYKSLLFKELLHVRINVFFPVISSKHARLGLELGTVHIIEFNKHMRHFRFLFKEVNPIQSGAIINKCNKV